MERLSRAVKILFILSFISGIVIILSTKVAYIPEKPLLQAEEFIALLATGQPEKAYALTIQRDDVGNTFEKFKSIVQQQCGSLSSTPLHIRLKVMSVQPYQSYGNRVRRMISGRQIEPSQIDIDFSVESNPTKFPPLFQVRQAYMKDGSWKINYFQSHAG